MPRKQIAVVEDNPDNRLLVSILLGEEYDLVEYETGRQAIDGLAAWRPALVLLDMALPEVDGEEVVRSLRRMPHLADVPVVALTAHAMRGDRERYLAAGCTSYVSKPIEDLAAFRGLVGRYAPPAG